MMSDRDIGAEMLANAMKDFSAAQVDEAVEAYQAAWDDLPVTASTMDRLRAGVLAVLKISRTW